MKKLVFIAGLPRSGSTLLGNILAQNPRFYASGSSPVVDMIRGASAAYDQHPFARSAPEKERARLKLGLLKGALLGAYEGVDADVVFDKNRGWPSQLELVATLLGGRERVHVILCVRDLRDVLASFEKLHRNTMATGATTQMVVAPVRNMTAVGRAQFILEQSSPVGHGKDTMIDAFTRGWRDRMFFVEYEALTGNPVEAMRALYKFLDEDLYEHDFGNVEMTTPEDDSVHGFVGLHAVRPRVEPQPPQWPTVFDAQVTSTPFWREVDTMARFYTSL